MHSWYCGPGYRELEGHMIRLLQGIFLDKLSDQVYPLAEIKYTLYYILFYLQISNSEVTMAMHV